MDSFAGMSAHWLWLILGVLLAVAEIMVPGFFLIWLALAAIATGLIALLLPIGVVPQVAVFAVLAVAIVYVARRWIVRNPIMSDDPLLNDRGARMIGEIVTVTDAIEGGQGRVKVGDGVWVAKGPDAAVGARVRITATSGSVLSVELA